MNFLLRARWHDYKSRSLYHLTLCKAKACPAFGRIAGDCDIPVGTRGTPYLQASPVGTAVKRALRELRDIHPALRLLQYALMPDHLHIALHVESELDEILGRKIAAFKVRVNDYALTDGVFGRGFNDQIILADRSLDAVYRYIRENPMRLALRFRHPEFFSRRDCQAIAGHPYQAYGNISLLCNPFKSQVVVHRADSADTRRKNHDRWLYTAANGGVLVSPFISPAEAEIRREAELSDAKIILITNEPLRDREKPSGRNFERCAAGKLLILAPLDDDFPRGFSRECCLAMNRRAAEIADTTLPADALRR